MFLLRNEKNYLMIYPQFPPLIWSSGPPRKEHLEFTRTVQYIYCTVYSYTDPGSKKHAYILVSTEKLNSICGAKREILFIRDSIPIANSLILKTYLIAM